MRDLARPVYADLHFHTHLSDNVDRATLEQMVARGRESGIDVFSVADHNHNLTAEKWTSLLAERDALRDPRIRVGCEGTFKWGHFVILGLDDARWTGDFTESFRALLDGAYPVILAHPMPWKDEWHAVLYPRIAAIELVNGAVLSHAATDGEFPTRLLDLPTLQAFFAYLDAGMLPAVTGSSDAHRLSEVGHGVTGFRTTDATPDPVAAILGRRTFAATDTSIDLDWTLDGSRLRWELHDAARAIEVPAADGASLALYRGRTLVCELDARGTLPLDEPGAYWIGYLAGQRGAISSPFRVGESAGDGGVLGFARSIEVHMDRLRHLEASKWAHIHIDGSAKPHGAAADSGALLIVFGRDPVLVGADGANLVAERRLVTPAVDLVHLRGDERFVEELRVYLLRNEIHEYRIIELDVDITRTSISGRGTLVPNLFTLAAAWGNVWNDLGERIVASSSSDISVDVTLSVLPVWEFDVPSGTRPIAVADRAPSSVIVSVAAQPPASLRPWIVSPEQADMLTSPHHLQLFPRP